MYRLKKMIGILFLGTCLLISIVALSNYWLINTSEGKVYNDVSKIPINDVGLVLGANPKIFNKYKNPYFYNRIDAAEKLYKSGKVKHLLLSGDNGTKGYNEPEEMKLALMERGVPESAITLDFAGFRTLDSIVRSQKIFQQKKITVLSQEFHNYRALFIANHYGIDAVAFNAKAVNSGSQKTIYREYLARFKAVLDLYILRKQPKFLGEKIDIVI